MASKGEALTVQIGQYSNFVGTHLWNLNEEVVRSGFDENLRYSRYYHESRGGKQSPRCLMLDLNENIGNLYEPDLESLENYSEMWGGNITKSIHSNFSQNSSAAAEAPKDIEGFNNWSDMIKFNVHSKSVCELPKWISKDDFDSYYKGSVGSPLAAGIPKDYIEDVTENIRYFAEACNNLSVINIYADFHDASGGLTASLLEAIREDFGRSVCLPVWAFTETSKYWASRTTQPDDLSIKNAMVDLNLPLCYANITEHTNILIPMDISDVFKRYMPQSRSTNSYSVKNNALKLSSSIAASVITAATSSGASDLTSSDGVHGIVDWCQSATKSGIWPICSVEAYIPPLYCLSQQSDARASTFEADVLQSFESVAGLSKAPSQPGQGQDRARIRNSNTSTTTTTSNGGLITTMNPFSLSFSACANGPFAARGSLTYVPPFTNVIRIRGSTNGDISSSLFEKCFGSPYRITSCTQEDTPLPLHLHHWYTSLSDPEIEQQQQHQHYQQQQRHKRQEKEKAEGVGGTPGGFKDTVFSGAYANSDDSYSKREGDNVSRGQDTQIGQHPGMFSHSVASVGATQAVGWHLQAVMARWQARSAACNNQLRKAGLEMEDCDELVESLRALAKKYDPSDFDR
jgi:hypothetical protein